MANKMYRAADLEGLVEDVGWEHEIPYRDLTRLNKKKTTSKTVYVDEGSRDMPISYWAINLTTFFIERPEAVKRVFEHHFPDLYDEYMDTPEARDLMKVKKARGPEGSKMNVLDRKGPCPMLQIVNKVEGRNVQDTIDNIRRKYIEPYRVMVEDNPTRFSVAYSSTRQNGEFGSFEDQDEMTKVVYSELEQNSAMDF